MQEIVMMVIFVNSDELSLSYHLLLKISQNRVAILFHFKGKILEPEIFLVRISDFSFPQPQTPLTDTLRLVIKKRSL